MKLFTDLLEEYLEAKEEHKKLQEKQFQVWFKAPNLLKNAAEREHAAKNALNKAFTILVNDDCKNNR